MFEHLPLFGKHLLQLDAFFPAVPWQLPFVVMGIGFVLLIWGLAMWMPAVSNRFPNWQSMGTGERALISTLFMIGILCATLPPLFRGDLVWWYAFWLTFVGRMIEGGVIVRFYRKVATVLLEQRGTGGLSDFIIKWIPIGIIGGFMSLLIVVAFVRHTFPTAVRLTAFVLTWGILWIVVIAISYQIRDITDQLGKTVSLGIVLSIAGAEIFNFPALTGMFPMPSPVLENPTGKFVVQWVGGFGFTTGTILAVILYWKRGGNS